MKKILISMIASLVVSAACAVDTGATIGQLAADDYKVRTQARTDLKLAYANAQGAERASLEAELITQLGADLPIEQRLYLIRLLEWFGSGDSADALAPLLTDSVVELRDSARRALVSIPGEKAAVALATGLRNATTTEAKAAFIDGLAYRKDVRAVPMIASLLQSKDVALVQNAARALGQIGSADALPALKAAYASGGGAKAELEVALLRLGGDATVAKSLAQSGSHAATRADGFAQLLRLDAQAADQVLADLLSQDAALGRSQILTMAAKQGSAPMQAKLAQHLAAASVADQTLIVTAFGEAGLSQYESELLAVLSTCGDWAQRNFIIHALGNIGGDASFEPIYQAFQKDAKNKVISDALARLKAPSADAKALAVVKSAQDAAGRISSMRVLELRNSPGATDLLNQVAAQPGDAKVREAAFKSLESIGSFESVNVLIQLILQNDSQTRSIQRSLKRLSQNFRAGQSLWNEYYKPALATAANDATREGLVQILDGVDSRDCLNYLKGHVLDADSALNKAAGKTLSRWSSVLAVDSWMEIAKKNPELQPQALKAIQRLFTSSQVTLSDSTAKVSAWVKAIKAAPTKEFKLALVSVFEEPPNGSKWIIKSRAKSLLKDPDVAEAVQAILAKCG